MSIVHLIFLSVGVSLFLLTRPHNSRTVDIRRGRAQGTLSEKLLIE
ncbi:hypothetical protein [Tunicatimonas pelagia]|nr:hypothetical protein [Tunicatimonas pelagia]WKN44947.1 hypothetical protein P0M28_08220 [Tunicatimonas pelagia]